MPKKDISDNMNVINTLKNWIKGNDHYYILELGFNSIKERDNALEVLKQEGIRINWFDMKNPREEKNG